MTTAPTAKDDTIAHVPHRKLPSASNTLTFNYRLKNSFGTSNTAKVTVNVSKLQ